MKRVRLEELESGLPGWKWRIEEGVEIAIDEKTTQQLARTIAKLVEIDAQLKKLKIKAKEVEKEEEFYREVVSEFAQNHPGWRGAKTSEFDILVTKRTKTEWDAEILRNVLGPLFNLLVLQERIVIEISSPIPLNNKFVRAPEIISAIKKALEGLGLAPSMVEEVLKVKEEIQVDEERFYETLANKKVQLPPTAKKESIIWEFRIRHFQEAS